MEIVLFASRFKTFGFHFYTLFFTHSWPNVQISSILSLDLVQKCVSFSMLEVFLCKT